MAVCDYLIAADIHGYDCNNPAAKGAESMGLLINREDIDDLGIIGPLATLTLKCSSAGHPRKAYKITQSGKQPFNGTQQEMAEGTYQNTMTNTVQFTILKQDSDTAAQLFALLNGEFVAVIPDKQGNYQIYGGETGLHCAGAVRELYNDDTLSGWQVTMIEEGAARGGIFITEGNFTMIQRMSAPCE